MADSIKCAEWGANVIQCQAIKSRLSDDENVSVYGFGRKKKY